MSLFVAFVLGCLMLVPAILVAIPVHEMGHAAAAYFLGDRSVRYFGYFTLDPRRFLDPLGVLSCFLALVGWGRRVPIQANRIGTTRQKVLYELGGPAASLLLAFALGLVFRGLLRLGLPVSFGLDPGIVGGLIYVIVFLNLSIFAFQLLPIPGLDGWNIIEALFYNRNPRFFFDVNTRRREIWAALFLIFILVSLINHTNLLNYVMSPFFQPASLISLNRCIGYGIPGLSGLFPCLL
ncbi:MAG TPA: site-2 protease family protein [Candidatus Dormibacteraeota bacterium]|nr:site-2 protease family protein [Candidatus Dormibacteraeota bacterium]